MWPTRRRVNFVEQSSQSTFPPTSTETLKTEFALRSVAVPTRCAYPTGRNCLPTGEREVGSQSSFKPLRTANGVRSRTLRSVRKVQLRT
jgi:hypothetical protein